MNPSRIKRISELLFTLKKGYDWCHKSKRNEERKHDLFNRSLPIFEELESLRVSRSFSASLFFFGFEITHEMLSEFEEESIGKGGIL